MSKTKTKTKTAVSKKPKKASADVLNDGREWVAGSFPFVRRDGVVPSVSGSVCESFGLLNLGFDGARADWTYLVHRATGKSMALFADAELASEAAAIVEKLGDWAEHPPSRFHGVSEAWARAGFYYWGDQDAVGNMVWRRRYGPYFGTEKRPERS